MPAMLSSRKILLFTFVLAATLILDQWTKIAVIHSSLLPLTLIDTLGGTLPAALSPFLRIILHQNTGIAFSISLPLPLIFILIALLMFFGGRYLLRELDLSKSLVAFTLALIVGGTLGNLLDRFRFGHVIDFISVWRLPVFNVADMTITCGIFVLVIFFSKLKRSGAQKPPRDEATGA
jgi:signal peptidase II